MKQKTLLERTKEKELHAFMASPQTFIVGFIERRKAANKAVADGAGLPAAEQKKLAEVAGFYNQLLNAAVVAFKGDYTTLLESLQMPQAAGNTTT